ncbi:MAG: DNA-3-methyladenine glycosylase I [Gammaproteobacteria bacterium]|nr:DNA-3-methyladenine glycosylase I [Gammaproteobacteria bacterium]
MTERCDWCGDDPLYVAYHDEEWGVPCRDERALFELMILEGMQAGLSWLTILRKRQGFRLAFRGFDPEVIAHFEERDRQRLLADAGIVRNRAKIDATIGNAQALLDLRARGIDFVDWIWDSVDGRPEQNSWRNLGQVPASTPRSTALSKRLRKAGFRFVGPTICYAWMQAAGLVNDHIVSCHRHAACAALAEA